MLGDFSIEDYSFSRSPSPVGGFAQQAVHHDDGDEDTIPFRRSIHGEMSKRLQNKLNAYYGINRFVKKIKHNVQPLEARRAKPVYKLFQGMQKQKSKSLVLELSRRSIIAYHESDIERVYAVSCVLDMFPLEIQYDLLRNYRDELLVNMGGDENVDDMFQVQLEQLSAALFPDEMEQSVREVVNDALQKELSHV